MKNMEYNNYELRYTNDVEEELDDIYNYISQTLKEPQIARRLINEIRQEIHVLKISPYLGQRVKEKPQKSPKNFQKYFIRKG